MTLSVLYFPFSETTPSTSPRGKLVELMRGMGQSAGNPVELVGQHCQITVKHESNKVGKRYAAITQTFR